MRIFFNTMLYAVMCQPASTLLDSGYIYMNLEVFDSFDLLQVGNKQIDCPIVYTRLADNNTSEFIIRWVDVFFILWHVSSESDIGVTVVSQKHNFHI